MMFINGQDLHFAQERLTRFRGEADISRIGLRSGASQPFSLWRRIWITIVVRLSSARGAAEAPACTLPECAS